MYLNRIKKRGAILIRAEIIPYLPETDNAVVGISVCFLLNFSFPRLLIFVFDGFKG